MNATRVRSRGTAALTGGAASGPDGAFFKALREKAYPKNRGKSNGEPIYIDSPTGRRCAGYIVAEGRRRILRKTGVDAERHYCRRHGGYGAEVRVLWEAERRSAVAVRLVFDSGLVLEAPLTAYMEHGVRDDLGFGPQVFLARRFFRNLSDPQGSLFAEG